MTMQDRRNRLTDIYGLYYPVVFSAVYTKVGDVDDTNDICQEVFLRLFERLDEVENVRRWLFSALKLVVLEHFRKKQKNEALNVDDVFTDISLTFVNGFRDSRMLIQEAIGAPDTFSDERERVIFDLVAINNFTYESVAKQLGMTRRQVEYRYTQTVSRITDNLRKKGISKLDDLL